MAWTKEQLEAIKTRNCNMLVSAAAGAGKTAVLVNRIIERVTDEKNPVDIDSIVVVTFTRAAAEEMKSRLAAVFYKKLEEQPENTHLIKQISLIDHAKISTIDSFCTYILGNYCNCIDFDPAYRVADPGELELLKADVFNELLEEKFIEGNSRFLNYVEAFASGKNFDAIRETVMKLYKLAESHPWQNEWLDACIRLYNISGADELVNTEFYGNILKYVKLCLKESMEKCRDMLEVCNEPSGPAAYRENIEADLKMITSAYECNDPVEMGKCLDTGFTRLKTIRNTEDESLKQYVQYNRNAVKNRINRLADSYLKYTPEEIYNMLEDSRPHAEEIIALTAEFSERYRLARYDRNIVDFSDIEHLALKILVKHEEGTEEYAYTEIADELAEKYTEIYVDEYQDSNAVQEAILTAVSGARFGRPNMFMVGDVKQSIYRFRMADPGLFMSKYDSYGNDGDNRKTELHNNFRSCRNVINVVNDVFSLAMHKSVGGVEYTEENRLNYGGTEEDLMDTATEIIVAEKSLYKELETDDREICANMAAMQIKKMLKEDTGLTYGDFVILLRSDKKSGPEYAEILLNHNIPAKYDSTTGYFSAREVSTVMNFLKIIDNPRQEIPLASTMKSFFANFNGEELAYIKGPARRTEFYDCVIRYSEKTDTLGEKCRNFLELLASYRRKAKLLTISELIYDVVYKSGYYDYMGLLPNGEVRKNNLDMLITKAADYEKTSYSGLFNFLRYIDEIKKYDVDYGEGQALENNENVVRIMSIHRSKGLEFPVVILGDASKTYNLTDTSGDIIMDSGLGIGINIVDTIKRIKYPSFIHEVIKNRVMTDSIGEELRILYVALTRARQKLIITGVANDTSVKAWNNAAVCGSIDTEYILSRKSYLDLVMAAYHIRPQGGIYRYVTVLPEELMCGRTEEVRETVGDISDGIRRMLDITDNSENDAEIEDMLEYVYPYGSIFSLKSKYSVSDIKHKAMEESEYEEVLVPQPEESVPVPEFVEKQSGVTGVFRGNAYHKFFEIMDYERCTDEKSIENYMKECIEKGKFPKEYADTINVSDFECFISSELARRMKKAYSEGVLFREQPFITEVGADMVDAAYPADEKVLIQGIVDAFFFEGDRLYIADYKTDRVPEGEKGEKILIERYKKQLELYGEALSRITGRKTGGLYIYSVVLGREIEIR